MKSTLTLLFVLLLNGLNAQENTPIYHFDNVYFMVNMPDAGEGKVRRLSQLITRYFDAIEKNDVPTWKACLSDSTISRQIERKFAQKVERLRGYGIQDDTIRVMEIRKLPKPSSNEVGTEYELILDFGVDLNVENRVSFDCIKGSKEHSNQRLFGINVIMNDKGYAICEHKYQVKTEGEGNGEVAQGE